MTACLGGPFLTEIAFLWNLGTTAALNAWTPLGSTSKISVVKSSTPVSSALPNSLALAVAAGTTGTVGFANSGFWGAWREIFVSEIPT